MRQSQSDKLDTSTLRVYENYASELSNQYERGDRSTIHERLVHLFPAGARVLDVGCGSGADVAFLAKRGFIAEGIDASLPMLVEAVRHHPELNRRLRHLSCPSDLSNMMGGGFQGISAQSVLMHLDRAQLTRSFQEFFRLLAPEGVLYISMFDSRDDLDRDGRDQPGRKFHLYSDEEIRELLSLSGFCVLESKAVRSDALGRPGVQLREYVAVKPQASDTQWSQDLTLPAEHGL
jgi:SAM-dependent methyltransferase